MAKLNQIIAVVSGKKTRTKNNLTKLYKQLQSPTLFDGISRTYQPLDEEGETFPPEQKLVQMTVGDALAQAEDTLTDLLDVVLTQDVANCNAKADIVVDGEPIALNIPVTYLLFLEKQLVDLHTFVTHIPTLDPAHKWEYDSNRGAYASEPTGSNKTKKVMRNHVLAEATKEHPAQVQAYTEDVKIGEWTTTKFSGAVPVDRKRELVARVETLQEAVKHARELANNTDVEDCSIGKKLFHYVFK